MKNDDIETNEPKSMRQPFIQSLSEDMTEEADRRECLCVDRTAMPLNKVITIAPAKAIIVPPILACALSSEMLTRSILNSPLIQCNIEMV